MEKDFSESIRASNTFHSSGCRFETQQQPDPYIAMLGGEFLGHGSQQDARVRVLDATFPGLQGLSEDFTLKEEWYSLKNFRQDKHLVEHVQQVFRGCTRLSTTAQDSILLYAASGGSI